MKINRTRSAGRPFSKPARTRPALGLAMTLALAACVAAPPATPPAPPPRPTPTPQPAPAPVSPVPRDWRDAPQTAGAWRYRADANGGVAQFGPETGSALLTLRCDRARRVIVIARAGTASGPLPMSVTTTSTTRPLSATPSPQQTLDVALPARDPLLDAMAFSRGRFAIEVNGLSTLYVPAWPEIGRVIEDCRR